MDLLARACKRCLADISRSPMWGCMMHCGIVIMARCGVLSIPSGDVGPEWVNARSKSKCFYVMCEHCFVLMGGVGREDHPIEGLEYGGL